MRIEEAENIDYLLGHISSLVDEQWHGRDGGDGVEEALHYRIKINPRLTSTKSKVPLSLIRFMDGLRELGHEPLCDDGGGVVGALHSLLEGGQAFLAYHGTSKRSITSICRDGWDPALRVSNPPDREWFGMRPSISLYYSTRAKSDDMLVACILKGPHVESCSWSGTHCVLNPPTHAYCLPLAVIHFSSRPFPADKWWRRLRTPRFLTLRQ